MRSAPCIVLLALSAVPSAFCNPGPVPGADVDNFQKLLDEVEPAKLHSALHDVSPKKFRDGIFSKDRTAVEALHRDDANLASSIVELAKRQDNGTSPAVPVSSPSTVEPAAGSTPSVATPAPVGPTTANAGSTTNAGSTPVTVVSTSTSPNGATATSTPPSESSGSALPTAGELITTTNAEGFTVVTTVGGGVQTIKGSASSGTLSNSITSSSSSSRHGGPSKTSISLSTATLSNGGKSTITAVTVVAGGDSAGETPSGTAGAGSPSGTAAGAPGLQTGVGTKKGNVQGWLIAVGVGALAFAATL